MFVLFQDPCYRSYGMQVPDVNSIKQTLCVATCHIHWDPEFCDVKLIQSMMLCDQLRRLIDEASAAQNITLQPRVNNSSPKVQLLMCGDFNSLPDSGNDCSLVAEPKMANGAALLILTFL